MSEESGMSPESDGVRHGRQRSRQASRAIVVAAAFVVLAIIAAMGLLKPSSPKPPPANPTNAASAVPGKSTPASDPESDSLLRAGKEIYAARCVSCHGPAGKGDGPLARALPAPAPRDLTAPNWKYGDTPEATLAVVSQGVKDTSMAGWSSMLGPQGTKSVTAYCLFLGKRAVPDAWREH